MQFYFFGICNLCLFGAFDIDWVSQLGYWHQRAEQSLDSPPVR